MAAADMKIFSGFPEGRLSVTPVPDLFFTELCPEIDDLAELKVTLHLLWRLALSKNIKGHVSLGELQADATLVRSLDAGTETSSVLNRALARATERGTFLCLPVSLNANSECYYFLNSELGRRAFAQMQRNVPPPDGVRTPEPIMATEHPNVFNLYEKTFGLLLTPVLADELIEAEREYPLEWIADALKETALQGKKSWKYARSILERWKAEGRTDPKKGKPWYGDEYGKYVKR